MTLQPSSSAGDSVSTLENMPLPLQLLILFVGLLMTIGSCWYLAGLWLNSPPTRRPEIHKLHSDLFE